MATSPVSYFENLFVIVELLKPVTKNFDPALRSALYSRQSWTSYSELIFAELQVPFDAIASIKKGQFV